MDIFSIYKDYGVPHYTEGYKQCRPGFVNIQCPFCQGHPFLSYHIENNYFVCWQCGWKPIPTVLSKLLGIDNEQAIKVSKMYGYVSSYKPKDIVANVSIKPFKFPSNSGPLQTSHRQYLEKRNFDPDYLERTWDLFGTGPVSRLKKENGHLDYSHRVLIPFYWNNKIVSFDARDITGEAMNKYQACPKERELIPHKEILYGRQEFWGDTGICVEGPTDVWRFGLFSFATSGVKYTPAQLRLMAKTFKRIAVVFDGPTESSLELEAENQAQALISDLKFRKVDAFRVNIKGDPGGMDQKEADYLVKQIIK